MGGKSHLSMDTKICLTILLVVATSADELDTTAQCHTLPNAPYAYCRANPANCNGDKMECSDNPKAGANWCSKCRAECGHFLSHVRFPAKVHAIAQGRRRGNGYSGSCQMASATDNCNKVTFCTDPDGAPADVYTKEYTCTRVCQPWFSLTVSDLDDSRKAALQGHYNRTTVHCNVYKRTHCYPNSQYTQCAETNKEKTILSGASKGKSNATHAECGPRSSCDVHKQVSCAKVCKMGNDWMPVASSCAADVCKPAYCSMTASFM